jgi:hypothetical protein
VAAPLDGRFGHLLERPKLLAGRQPAPGRPAEIMVDETAARALHLRVGSTLVLGAVTNSGAGRRRLAERVVGIAVTRGSVVPVTALDRVPAILASTALYRRLGPGYLGFDGAYVKLRPGASAAAFGAAAEALARHVRGTGAQVFVADEHVQAATIERAIRPQAVALAVFALVLAVTALLIVGQVASRLLLAAGADNPPLAALGMTRGQLLAAGLVEVAVAAAAGGALACGAAVAASPIMPIGPARLAEPHPGISVDGGVLAAGFAAIVVLLVARAAWPAWRLASSWRAAARAPGPPSARGRAAAWLAAAGAPLTATTGVRMALEPGRGRTAVPVRSALAGTALSAAAVAAALTFGASLLHLVHTPRLYGKDWDAAVDIQFGGIPAQRFSALAARLPGVSAWTFGLHGTVRIGRALVPAIGLAAGRGPLITPTVLQGHPPAASRQVMLGTSVLRSAGLRVGQAAWLTAAGHAARVQITGRTVLPFFGQGSFTPTDLGQGAVVPAALLAPQSAPAGGGGYNFVLVRFAPRARAAGVAAFRRAMAPYCRFVEQSTCLVSDQRPNGVRNYARIDLTPQVLAGLLAALGLGVLGQFVAASARRRRRDFAVLKTLGLLRRQLTAVTAWQVTTLAGLALLAGLPLGVAAGHWAWAAFAGALGISPGAVTPVEQVLAIVPAVLLAANLVALVPGLRGARLRPAELLRAE